MTSYTGLSHVGKIKQIKPVGLTCWQMLAYLARTLAFSAMPRADGQPSEILSTQRHLAKSAPSFLYCAQRSDKPSRPNGQKKEKPRHSHLAVFCVLISQNAGEDKRFYLVWLSPHLCRSDQLCLCPPVVMNKGKKHVIQDGRV